ncbi:TonB-dependent receptor domain-containing protein [Caulobacter segnis]
MASPEDVDADQLFDQASNASYIRSKLKTKSVAVFGQASWSLTDRLRVTGGLRWTKDNKKQDSYAENRPFVGFYARFHADHSDGADHGQERRRLRQDDLEGRPGL